MIYLSGVARGVVLGHAQAGVILTPESRNRPDLSCTAWAADNGCFTQGERFSGPAFLRWLASRREDQARCLFAVAPDVCKRLHIGLWPHFFTADEITAWPPELA